MRFRGAIIDIWAFDCMQACESCTLRLRRRCVGVRRNPAAVGHDCSRSGCSWASGDGLYNGRVRCRSRWLLHPAAVGFEPGRRVARGNVELRVFPTYRTDCLRRQCFLPVGLSDYLRRHASTFDVAHLHASAIYPRHCCATSAGRGVPYLLAPNGRRRFGATPRRKMAVDLVLGKQVMNGAARVLRSPTPNAGNWRGWVYRRSVYAWCPTR